LAFITLDFFDFSLLFPTNHSAFYSSSKNPLLKKSPFYPLSTIMAPKPASTVASKAPASAVGGKAPAKSTEGTKAAKKYVDAFFSLFFDIF
jgi:hypothetical protein